MINIPSLDPFKNSNETWSQEQAVRRGTPRLEISLTNRHKVAIKTPSQDSSEANTEPAGMSSGAEPAVRGSQTGGSSQQLTVPTLKDEVAEAQVTLAVLALLPDPERKLSPQVLPHLNLEEFHLFPNLPIEIRLLIWKQISTSTLIVQRLNISIPRTPNIAYKIISYFPKHGLPITFHINRESRMEAFGKFRCFVMPFLGKEKGMGRFGWFFVDEGGNGKKDGGKGEREIGEKPPFEMLLERVWWFVDNEFENVEI